MTNGDKHIEKLLSWYKEVFTEDGVCHLTSDDLDYIIKCCKHFEDIKKDIDSWGLREEPSSSEKPNMSENPLSSTTKSETLVSLDVYNQVAKERDMAIQQLHELGYELGVSLPDIKYHSHHCVDRRLVEALVYKYLGEATDNHVAFYEELLDLPLVTPIKPRGHWIEEFDDLEGEVRFTCSNCRKYQLFGTDFCYHCGSENREVKENGEKIEEIFPNLRITVCEFYVQVMGEQYEFSNTYPLKWWNAEYKEPTTKNDIRACKSCVYSKDGKCAGTEECHLCMWKNQYKPTTKNDLEIVMDAMEYRTNALIENIKSEIMHFANAHCSGDDINIYDVFKVIDDCCKAENLTTKNDLGVDAVSRKAVLNTLDNMDSALDNEDRTVETYKELLKECYKVLPSVTPQEPKTGHWIRVDKYKLRCSECEVIHLIAQYPNGKIDWCPNCGAKMVEPQESEG